MTAVRCPGPFKPHFSFCLPAAEMDPDEEGHWVSCWAWSRLGEAPDPGVSRSPTSGSPCWGVASRGRATARARDLWKKLWKKKLKTRNYFFFRQLEKKIKQNQTQCCHQILSRYLIPHERVSLGLGSRHRRPCPALLTEGLAPRNGYQLGPCSLRHCPGATSFPAAPLIPSGPRTAPRGNRVLHAPRAPFPKGVGGQTRPGTPGPAR